MKVLTLIMTFLVLLSCEKPLKRYQYIVLFEDEEGEKALVPEIIEAKNDSAAFVQIYTDFCIRKQMDYSVENSNQKAEFRTIGFKILDADNKDITKELKIKNADSIMVDISLKIFGMPKVVK